MNTRWAAALCGHNEILRCALTSIVVMLLNSGAVDHDPSEQEFTGRLLHWQPMFESHTQAFSLSGKPISLYNAKLYGENGLIITYEEGVD